MEYNYLSRKKYFSPSGSKSILRVLVPVCFVLLSCIFNAFGQISNTLYFMNKVPQSSLLNPAIVSDYQLYVGIPVLNSVNFGLANNFASYNDIIFKSPVSDSLITFLHPEANKNSFINTLREANSIRSDMHLSLITIGYSVGKHHFSFSINERFSFRGTIPKDLFVLLLKGNDDYIGKKASFSSFGLDLSMYREYAFGYAQKIDDQWLVGGRAKLLFGKGNLYLSEQNISLYTNPADYQMKLNSRFTMNTSLPITVEYNDEGKINNIAFDDDFDALPWVFNNSNRGLAFDLGVTHKPMEALTVSAGILDLGFIKWTKDVYNFSMDGELDFNGLDLSSTILDENDDNVFENFFDSIADIFAISETRKSYIKYLSTKIFLAGEYELNPKLRLGALSRTGFANNKIEQAITFSANSNVNEWFSASLSYSMMNNSFNNLGVGFCIVGGPFQFYMVSDNLNFVFVPHKTKSVNLLFGMNLIFGHRKQPKTPEPTESNEYFNEPQ